MKAEAAPEIIHSRYSEKDPYTEESSCRRLQFNTRYYQRLAGNGVTHASIQSLSASTECLAKGLRDSDVRRSSAAVHHLSDIPIDLIHIDDADSGLRGQIAVIEHGGRFPVVVRGTKQIGAPHPLNVPSTLCNLRFRRGPWRGRRSDLLRRRRGRRLLRW